MVDGSARLRQLPRMRQITRRYRDPLDQLWTAVLDRVGFELARSSEVFAASDGAVLTLGTAETLDKDDCLAQMIFHELCHSLVQGPELLREADWGLDNEGDQHLPNEYACLRLQAALLTPLGLRQVLAPTTDHRVFYDALPLDPLEGESVDPEAVDVRLAKAALARVEDAPWGPHLQQGLAVTAEIVGLVSAYAAPSDLLQRAFTK